MSKENQNLTFLTREEDIGKRLDVFLSERVEEWSRSRLKKLIDDGDVLVNGGAIKSSYKLRANDEISVDLVFSDADDFELMNDPRLNIVSFRYNPGGMSDGSLDDLNERLGEAVIADGRYLVGTSKMGARTIFRPAFSNWRTRKTDVEEMLGVIREVAAKTTITNRGVGT